jgi:hypothetical protein
VWKFGNREWVLDGNLRPGGIGVNPLENPPSLLQKYCIKTPDSNISSLVALTKYKDEAKLKSIANQTLILKATIKKPQPFSLSIRQDGALIVSGYLLW